MSLYDLSPSKSDKHTVKWNCRRTLPLVTSDSPQPFSYHNHIICVQMELP